MSSVLGGRTNVMRVYRVLSKPAFSVLLSAALL